MKRNIKHFNTNGVIEISHSFIPYKIHLRKYIEHIFGKANDNVLPNLEQEIIRNYKAHFPCNNKHVLNGALIYWTPSYFIFGIYDANGIKISEGRIPRFQIMSFLKKECESLKTNKTCFSAFPISRYEKTL